jgi:hypothetical protein
MTASKAVKWLQYLWNSLALRPDFRLARTPRMEAAKKAETDVKVNRQHSKTQRRHQKRFAPELSGKRLMTGIVFHAFL